MLEKLKSMTGMNVYIKIPYGPVKPQLDALKTKVLAIPADKEATIRTNKEKLSYEKTRVLAARAAVAPGAPPIPDEENQKKVMYIAGEATATRILAEITALGL